MSSQNTALALADDQRDLQRLQEFNTDAAVSRSMKEVEAAFIIAQKFPRNEDAAYMALMKSCERTSFAERVEYSYPRGKKKDEETGKWVDNIVSGPSVYLSREMTRIWRHLQVGTEIIRDDEDSRHIRSHALDLETNVRRFAEATFRKLIQRNKKEKDAKTGKMQDVWPRQVEWVRPDERDLRELSNKQSAITERNCSLQIMPFDFIEDARMKARETLAKGAAQDPEGTRKRLLVGFGSLNVTVEMLEEYLGHAVAQCSPAQLVDLRKLWAAIAEGQTTWADVMESKREAAISTVTEGQANEWFQAYKASGITTETATKWLNDNFKVKDSRKIPVEEFDKAMQWAKTKPSQGEKKLEPKAEVISPNNAPPPVDVDVTPKQTTLIPEDEGRDAKWLRGQIDALFDLHGTPPKLRASLLRDNADKMQSLYDDLKSNLPAEGE